MNNKRIKITALLPLTLRAWVAVALLVILSSFEAIKVVHVDHHHSTSIELCSENDEADACHRAIVHSDAESGCSHSRHLDQRIADCEICDALVTSYLFEPTKEISTPVSFAEVDWKQNAPEKPHSVLITFPQHRGPPVWS